MTKYKKEVDAYKSYIRRSAKLVCGYFCDKHQIEQDIEDIVNLEAKLAQVMFLFL